MCSRTRMCWLRWQYAVQPLWLRVPLNHTPEFWHGEAVNSIDLEAPFEC